MRNKIHNKYESICFSEPLIEEEVFDRFLKEDTQEIITDKYKSCMEIYNKAFKRANDVIDYVVRQFSKFKRIVDVKYKWYAVKVDNHFEELHENNCLKVLQPILKRRASKNTKFFSDSLPKSKISIIKRCLVLIEMYARTAQDEETRKQVVEQGRDITRKIIEMCKKFDQITEIFLLQRYLYLLSLYFTLDMNKDPEKADKFTKLLTTSYVTYQQLVFLPVRKQIAILKEVLKKVDDVSENAYKKLRNILRLKH